MSQFASALESARTLTLEAAAVASSKLGESSYKQYSKTISPRQLKTLLNSRNTREVKDGLKCLISAMALGDNTIDAKSYLPDVVKTVHTDDMRIRRLVALYLVRYAEIDQDVALLVVNSLQKLVNDTLSETRAFSIKSLVDMRLKSLEPIIIHGMRKSVSDPSAIVRSEVAYTIAKIYTSAYEDFQDELEITLKELLADSDPTVISSVIVVFYRHFLDHLDWLHGHFRRYCNILHELDSNAQIYMITSLTLYSKRYIPKPLLRNSENEKESMPLPDDIQEIIYTAFTIENDPDLDLLLSGIRKLIYSDNFAVLLTCCQAILQLSTPGSLRRTKFPEVIANLINNSRTNGSIKSLILQNILLMSTVDPQIFTPYFRQFFLYPTDNIVTAEFKLKVLSSLVTEETIDSVATEIRRYVYDDLAQNIKKEAMIALGICGQLSELWESKILKWLLRFLTYQKLDKNLMDTAVDVIRVLLHSNPRSHIKTVLELSTLLESQDILHDKARSGIIWLFGEIARVEFSVCPDVLRKLTLNFAQEGRYSRHQILLLAAKLLSYDISANTTEDVAYDYSKSRLYQIFNTLIYLAKYDDDFDIRDRARMLGSLFHEDKLQIGTLLLQGTKPEPQLFPSNYRNRDGSEDQNVKSLISYGVSSSLINAYLFRKWEYSPDPVSENQDIREPTPTKDYRKYYTSISSDSFKGRDTISNNAFPSSIDRNKDFEAKPSKDSTYVSKRGQKYKLQSLEEFFSDIPEQPNKKSLNQSIDNSTGDKKPHTLSEEEDTEEESDEGSNSESETGEDDLDSSEEYTDDSSD